MRYQPSAGNTFVSQICQTGAVHSDLQSALQYAAAVNVFVTIVSQHQGITIKRIPCEATNIHVPLTLQTQHNVSEPSCTGMPVAMCC